MNGILSITGSLRSDPEPRKAETGTDWTTATLVAALPCSSTEGETRAVQVFSVIGFGPKASELARHRGGDVVAVTGELRVHRWLRRGEERRELQIVVKQIAGVRSVMGRRRPKAVTEQQEASA